MLAGITSNPVTQRADGFYTVLPRRFGLRGAEWWIGPYKRRSEATMVAGLARRGFAQVAVERPQGQRFVFVGISGGFRLHGPPVIGPFDTRAEAARALGKLLPGQPPAGREPLKPATRETPLIPAPEERERPPRLPWQEPTEPMAPAGRVKRPRRPTDAATERLDVDPGRYRTVRPRTAGVKPAQVEDHEAVSALVGLGYKKVEARTAVAAALERTGAGAEAETVVREVFRMQRASNPVRSDSDDAPGLNVFFSIGRKPDGTWEWEIRRQTPEGHPVWGGPPLARGEADTKQQAKRAMDAAARRIGKELPQGPAALPPRQGKLLNPRKHTSEQCPGCGYRIRVPRTARQFHCPRCHSLLQVA